MFCGLEQFQACMLAITMSTQVDVAIMLSTHVDVEGPRSEEQINSRLAVCSDEEAAFCNSYSREN